LSAAGTVPDIFRRHAGRGKGVATLKRLTQERFRLPEDSVVMVAELACTVPGCPPVETVFAFWLEDGQRRQFKIFKPAAEITEADLPPWWMKDALILPDWIDCSCC
jgi:hypothetical protein